MNSPGLSACAYIPTYTGIYAHPPILSYFRGLSRSSIKIQRIVLYQGSQEFPQNTLCQEIYRVDSVSSPPRRVVCSTRWPICWSVSCLGHLLLSGLKSPGGTVSASGGKPCAESGSRPRAQGVMNLLSGTSQATSPPHKTSQRGSQAALLWADLRRHRDHRHHLSSFSLQSWALPQMSQTDVFPAPGGGW